jgi:hypothetical protein
MPVQDHGRVPVLYDRQMTMIMNRPPEAPESSWFVRNVAARISPKRQPARS